MLPFRGLFVCMFVCHVRALCSNGRRYRHDFFYIYATLFVEWQQKIKRNNHRHTKKTNKLTNTTTPCVSKIALKFGLHLSTPSSPNIVPKWPTPVDLSVRDIRWQIADCGRIVRDSATVTTESLYRKPPSLFRTLTPTTSRSQNEGPNTPGPTSLRVLPHGVTRFLLHTTLWAVRCRLLLVILQFTSITVITRTDGTTFKFFHLVG